MCQNLDYINYIKGSKFKVVMQQNKDLGRIAFDK